MKDDDEKPVLVVGGTGVFGSRLAEGLVRDGVPGVTIAGRGAARLSETAARLGCRSVELDIADAALETRLVEIAPRIVIDAVGPFQYYSGSDPYRLARAALAVGADYFDLSDDARFTAGIKALDGDARAAGRSVISGVSSVPALSAAAVRALSSDLDRTDLIDSIILPGNRAPRGRSVIEAILAQAGQPMPNSDRWGWIGTERIDIEPVDAPGFSRLASPIGAPDLVLIPDVFGTSDVRFRAGLELGLLHRGLEALAWVVRVGLLKSARPLRPVVVPLARMFEPFGTDVGAMRVLVRGWRADLPVERVWTLMANAGEGPHVPAIPGRVLVGRLLAGKVAPGARACMDEMTLEDCEAAAPERAFAFHRQDKPFHPLFAEVLGDAFARLPQAVQDLHQVAGTRDWRGAAAVTRGPGRLAGLVARAFGFPPECSRTEIYVRMTRRERSEDWTRDFGGHRFVSRLWKDPRRGGRMWERFGPFAFAIDLEANETGLEYPVAAGRLLGLPLPRALLPTSRTLETTDAEGRVTFDVALAAPFIGDVVRYRGWLMPDQPIIGDHELPDAS